MLTSSHRKANVHRPLSRAVPFTTASARYQREVMRDTPKAFYPLQDRSGNPVDVSGNGLDMTSISGTADYLQAGPMGDDYSMMLATGETMARSTQVSTVTNNFTMELWLRIESTLTDQNILINGNVASNGWGIRANDGNTFLGLAAGVAEQTGRGFPLPGWFHLVVQRDGSDSNRWKYYVDGASCLANAGTSNPGTPSGTLTLGGTSIQMSVAYVAIYESVLSSTRIAAHYAASGRKGTP